MWYKEDAISQNAIVPQERLRVNDMRIAVVGVGGVGGCFGGRLAQSGEDVVFIARGDNLQAKYLSKINFMFYPKTLDRAFHIVD